MHSQGRKKVEKGWVEHQDHSGLSSWISIIPFHLKKGGENSQKTLTKNFH